MPENFEDFIDPIEINIQHIKSQSVTKNPNRTTESKERTTCIATKAFDALKNHFTSIVILLFFFFLFYKKIVSSKNKSFQKYTFQFSRSQIIQIHLKVF